MRPRNFYKTNKVNSTNLPQAATGSLNQVQAGTTTTEQSATHDNSRRLGIPSLLIFVILVGIFAIVGGVLALNMLQTGEQSLFFANQNSKTFYAGDNIPTSFGTISVEHVEKTAGTPANQMGAMGNMRDMVEENQAQLEITVSTVNKLKTPLTFSPNQFRLITSDKKAPMYLRGANTRPQALMPNTGIESLITFVIPREGEHLWLEFMDPGLPQPVQIHLGNIDNHPVNDTNHLPFSDQDHEHEQNHK